MDRSAYLTGIAMAAVVALTGAAGILCAALALRSARKKSVERPVDSAMPLRGRWLNYGVALAAGIVGLGLLYSGANALWFQLVHWR